MSQEDVGENGNLLLSHIHSKKILWGRKAQQKQLLNSRDDQTVQIALVHGESGSGKTSLVKDVFQERPADDNNNETHKRSCFVFGKFDQYHDNSSPYSALVQALGGLPQQNKNDNALLSCAKTSLQREAAVLCELIPSFASLVHNGDDVLEEDKLNGKFMISVERLVVAVLSFLKDICQPEHPVILAIDDIQWTDENSSKVIKAMVEAEIPHLLFVGIYREEEANADAMQPLLQTIQQQNPRRVCDVFVNNLDKFQISEMVFDMLSINEPGANDSEDFVDLLYTKTSGNVYHIIQILIMLERKGLLFYNFAELRWQWEPLESLRKATTLADNVASIVAQKVQTLPASMIKMLQLAACIGFVFDVEVLEELMSVPSLNISSESPATVEDEKRVGQEVTMSFLEMLESAVSENLLDINGGALYRFGHDQIQKGVLEVLDNDEIQKVHWSVGTYLREKMETSSSHRSKYLFLAADQLNKGWTSGSRNNTERLALISLNYEASCLAKQRNGLDLIALFLGKAMELIEDTDWETSSYDLILNIHDMVVDFQSSSNEFSEGLATVQLILDKSKSAVDTITALEARAQIRITQYNNPLAMKDVKAALRLCGESLPPANILSVIRGVKKAKRMVKGLSDKDLLGLPELKDGQKKSAIKLYLIAIVSGFQTSNSPLMVLAFLGILRITLLHGRSAYTGSAFACFGTVLLHTGDIEGACRFAQLGIKAIVPGRAGDPTIVPVYAYCFVLHAKLPLSSFVDSLLDGYRKGLELGDTYYGCILIAAYTDAYKASGYRLQHFVRDCEKFLWQLRTLKNEVMQAFMLPNFQLAFNLTGESRDQIISWDSMLEHGFIEDVANMRKLEAPNVAIMSNQIFNAYVARDEQVAEKSMKEIMKLPYGQAFYESTHFNNMFMALTYGIAGFWLSQCSRSRSSKRYLQFAQKSINLLKKQSNINTVPLRMLLEAQKASLTNNDVSKVQRMYDEVIPVFVRAGLVHFGAIASEQCGDFLLKHRRTSQAMDYLTRAADLFQEWGAVVCVKRLVETHKVELKESSGTTLRGRERWKSTVDSAKKVESSSDVLVMVGESSHSEAHCTQ